MTGVNAMLSTPVDKPVDTVWTSRDSLWSAMCVSVHKAVGDTPGSLQYA